MDSNQKKYLRELINWDFNLSEASLATLPYTEKELRTLVDRFDSMDLSEVKHHVIQVIETFHQKTSEIRWREAFSEEIRCFSDALSEKEKYYLAKLLEPDFPLESVSFTESELRNLALSFDKRFSSDTQSKLVKVSQRVLDQDPDSVWKAAFLEAVSEKKLEPEKKLCLNYLVRFNFLTSAHENPPFTRIELYSKSPEF